MYQDILADPVKESLSVFDMFLLNKKLYSHYPNPDFGGSIRQNNTLVLGAKFETVEYHDILPELAKLDKEVKDYYSLRHEIPMSEYVKHVVRTHHQITVIHPFQDGNGRTSRAFMNVQLVRAGLLHSAVRNGRRCVSERTLCEAKRTPRNTKISSYSFGLITTV